MSPLHHDRLLEGGAVPAETAAAALRPSDVTTTASSAVVEEKATSPVPPQRQGKAQSAGGRRATGSTTRTPRSDAAGAGTPTSARTRTATAKAATAKAVTVTAATARAATAKAATATAVTRKAAGTARTVVAATTKASAAAKAPAAKPAAAKARAARLASAKARAGGRHRAEVPSPAAVSAVRAAVAQAIAAKVAADARATRRPTPYKRARVDLAVLEPVADATTLVEPQPPAPESAIVVVKDAPAPTSLAPVSVEPWPALDGERPDAEPDRVVQAAARGRLGAFLHLPLSVRRRPALYLAAALVGALSIGGAAAASPTQVQTQTVSHSVSVAEQLGIADDPAAAVDEDDTSRLRELVASRNERDAERVAAADAQAEADRLAAEEAARAAAEAARPKAVNPVEGARLTSGFGARWGTLHAGIDLAAPMRTPEYAAMDGIVLEAGPASGFGLAVYIQHENGDVTVYGHMDEILVEPGQVVRAGDTIALVGNRGQSTGPHLHFEVHQGGIGGPKVDPLPWLRERGVDI